MTQLPDVDSGAPGNQNARPGRMPPLPMDRSQVCAIVAETAAQVLSEIRAGIWHPPTTLRVVNRRRLA
jgi:hypothetical protein